MSMAGFAIRSSTAETPKKYDLLGLGLDDHQAEATDWLIVAGSPLAEHARGTWVSQITIGEQAGIETASVRPASISLGSVACSVQLRSN